MSYFIHDTCIVDDNVHIGDFSKIWHFSHISTGACIGNHTSLGQNTFIGKDVRIGSGVKIQNNVSVYSGVEIEDNVFCGPSMVFTNDLTPRAPYPKGSENFVKTLVKEGASIGANSTIVCGNTIGKWAMVAAGSVVCSDVKDYSLVKGAPARHYAWVCECGKKLDNTLECDCGRKYIELESGLKELK